MVLPRTVVGLPWFYPGLWWACHGFTQDCGGLAMVLPTAFGDVASLQTAAVAPSPLLVLHFEYVWPHGLLIESPFRLGS